MTIFHDLEDKLSSLKAKAVGDFHDLVLHIEAIYHHMHVAHAEPLVKEAIATELHAAAVKVDNIVNQVRLGADMADKVVDIAATAVDTAVKKK